MCLTWTNVDDCPVCRAGGPWLITDMRRGETIFDIDPHLQVRLYQLLQTHLCAKYLIYSVYKKRHSYVQELLTAWVLLSILATHVPLQCAVFRKTATAPNILYGNDPVFSTNCVT